MTLFMCSFAVFPILLRIKMSWTLSEWHGDGTELEQLGHLMISEASSVSDAEFVLVHNVHSTHWDRLV